MDWKADYAGKRTTAAEALKCVKSGDRVVFAHACGEPLDLVDALVARAADLERVEINHMVAMGKGEYCKPEYADAFYHKSLFVGASSRAAVKDGRGDYIPVFFHEIPKLFCEGYLTPDVVLIQVSPPDKHGFCSFGISVDYTKPAAQVAKTVVAGLPVDDPGVPPGTTVHLSGCPRACASGHQLVAEGDKRWACGAPLEEPATSLYEPAGEGGEGAPAGRDRAPVVVIAGELVDGVPTPSPEIAPTVTRKIKE
jgi:4-hydroxybutyrate CoA-transferase